MIGSQDMFCFRFLVLSIFFWAAILYSTCNFFWFLDAFQDFRWFLEKTSFLVQCNTILRGAEKNSYSGNFSDNMHKENSFRGNLQVASCNGHNFQLLQGDHYSTSFVLVKYSEVKWNRQGLKWKHIYQCPYMVFNWWKLVNSLFVT